MTPNEALRFAVSTLVIAGCLAFPSLASGLVTAEEAAEIVLTEVIEPDPRAPQMVGFFYGQSSPSKQLLLPGETVSDLEGAYAFTAAEPTYFFWIDTDPGLEWLHEALFAFVGEESGLLTVGIGESWPRIGETEHVAFTRLRNDSPDLFYGAYPPADGAAFSFAPATQAPSQQWAIIAVGRNLDGEDEKKARKNDLARIQDYLNKNDAGPKIPAGNITSLTGADTTGTTVQAVCDAIDALQGQGCDKIWFFYAGHGGRGDGGNCILQNPDEDETDRLTFEKLACKLLELGDVEVCVVMACCYSGKAVEALQKKKVKRDGKKVSLKGTILTSGSNNTTKREPDGSGSVFWKAVDACLNDPLADYDGDGKITLLEALAWARDNNPALVSDKPRGEGLGDKREIKFAGIKETWSDTGSYDGAGTIRVSEEKHSYKIKKGSSTGRDTTICRTNFYVKNTSNSPRAPRKDIRVRFYDKNGQLIGQEIFRACLGARERRCLFRVPEGTASRRIGPVPIPGPALPKSAPGGEIATAAIDYRHAEFVPGEIIFDYIDVPAVAGSAYSAEVIPIPDYLLETMPPFWVAPTWAPDQLVFLCGTMPVVTPEGVEIEWWVTDGSDSSKVAMNARLFAEDQWPCGSDRDFRRNVVSSPLVEVCGGALLGLENSCLEITSDSELQLESSSTLQMAYSAVQADSAIAYTATLFGTVAFDHADFIEPDAVALDGASGTIFHLGVFESKGVGLELSGDLSGLSSDFVSIDGAVGDGVVFDGTSSCAIRHLSIENTGGFDVHLHSGAEVTLVDASFDDANVTIANSGGELRKSWSAALLVFVADEVPLGEVSVTVTDATGLVVATGTTDGAGALDLPDLLEYVRTESSNEAHTPHTVELTFAGTDTTFSYTANQPDVLVVDWIGATSGTPEEPSAPSNLTRIVSLSPNPFRPGTEIRYELSAPGSVTLDAFDVHGRHVRSIPQQPGPAGFGTASWDGKDDRGHPVGSGVYLLRLKSGSETSWARGVLIR